MKCGQRGCSCTTCENCGRDLSYCVCDLKARTQNYIKDETIGSDCNEAYGLLLEWLETI
jgi:hypothetical protein